MADPWILVPTLFGQCYIGGWTAPLHWELTEQLFNETVVFTTRRVVKERVTAQGAVFLLHNISENRLFGLKTFWRGSAKVSVSDPARTLLDLLAMPGSGGGIDHVAECVAMWQMINLMAESERTIISERTRAGVKDAQNRA